MQFSLVKATTDQLDTLRNLSSTAERLGYAEASRRGFASYSRGKIGQSNQEEINARIHGIREIIRNYHGSIFADSIA
jgi:hypothetical protein